MGIPMATASHSESNKCVQQKMQNPNLWPFSQTHPFYPIPWLTCPQTPAFYPVPGSLVPRHPPSTLSLDHLQVNLSFQLVA